MCYGVFCVLLGRRRPATYTRRYKRAMATKDVIQITSFREVATCASFDIDVTGGKPRSIHVALIP